MESETILAQIDALFAEWQLDPQAIPSWEAFSHLEDSVIAQRTTRAIALLECYAPSSPYMRAAQEPFENKWGSESSSTFVAVAAALAAFRADLEGGYLRTIEELIHADLFADFLEMATELLEKGYDNPAAVIAGSVLEEHLRKLAVSNGVLITDAEGRPLKAGVINAGLAKKQVYNKLLEKSVTAWLGLRNSAAHGHYEDYEAAQVEALIRDVRGFIVAHPA